MASPARTIWGLWMSRPPIFSGWLAGWLGERGEREAAAYLRRQGYRILARRYRTAHGEIDLIAEEGEWLVFVEVKTRRGDHRGHPIEAVTTTKQRQLSRLAAAFLKRYRVHDRRVRFDVVAVIDPGAGQPVAIEHIRHAFDAAE